MCGTEKRPVLGNVAAEKARFGNGKAGCTKSMSTVRTSSMRRLTRHNGCNKMAKPIEEEEFADRERLDNHYNGSSDRREEADDIASSDHVEDSVTWPSQGSFEEGHA